MIWILFEDGEVLTCNTLEVNGTDLIADGYRIVSIFEIERIEGSDGFEE